MQPPPKLAKSQRPPKSVAGAEPGGSQGGKNKKPKEKKQAPRLDINCRGWKCWMFAAEDASRGEFCCLKCLKWHLNYKRAGSMHGEKCTKCQVPPDHASFEFTDSENETWYHTRPAVEVDMDKIY